MQMLQNSNGQDYFDKYRNPVEEVVEDGMMRGEARALNGDFFNGVLPDEVGALLGRETADVLLLANRLEGDEGDRDDLERARSFVDKYEDDVKAREYLRQKKIPPTKAYVGLLSLYDQLNKESKRLGLNKYQVWSRYLL